MLKLRILRVIFSFFLLFPILLLAQGQVFWQENGVCVCNGRYGGSLTPITIIKSGDEAAMAIYQYHLDDYYWVYAQRIDNQGNCLWTQNGLAISTPNPVSNYYYAIEDGKGGAIVVWTNDFVGQYADQICAQRVDSNGTLLWGPNGVIITGSQIPVAYSVTSVSDMRGGAIIAWIIGYGFEDSSKLFVQRIDSAGNLCWNANGILLTDSFPVIIYNCGLISDEKGGAIIVWVDIRNGVINHDIYAQRIDSSGSILWQSGGVGICVINGFQRYYRCARSINSTIISWCDERYSDKNLYAQRISDTGENLWQGNGVPICTIPGLNGVPIAIVRDSCGGTFIFWGDDRCGNYDIYAQRIDSSGAICWEPGGIFVNTAVPEVPQSFELEGISDNRGGAIICWQDYRHQNWDIYCQRIQEDGRLAWQDTGLAVCTDTLDQKWGPAITSDGQEGAIIIWGDKRGWPYASVYGQRVGDAVPIQEDIKTDENIDIKLDIYPNPSKGGVKIEWQIPERELVSVGIYDSQGRFIKNLKNGIMSKGVYIALWNGRDELNNKVPCGVYFCRLLTTKSSKIKKINLAW